MKNEVRPTQSEGGLGRREFLLLTSSCAAATLALGPNLFASAPSSSRDVAIGFLPLVDVTSSSDRLTPLVAADSVPGSDGSFLRRGVRVRVAGIGLGSESRRTIVFQPHYLVNGADLTVDAWRFNRATSVGGGLSDFGMPIDVDQRLRFSLITGQRNAPRLKGNDTPDDRQTNAVTFSLLSEADVVRLTRGYYVIAPLHDGAAAPRWNATTLRTKNGQVLLHELKNGQLQPVDREHFVLKFDYAKV